MGHWAILPPNHNQILTMKNLTLGAVLLLILQTTGFAQYTMTVEDTPAVTAGLTTYRFYVDMQDATDRMSAVFGNDQASLLVNTPGGAFNSPFNSSWNASGINPAFLPVFPDLADDTYATIGLTGPHPLRALRVQPTLLLWRTTQRDHAILLDARRDQP